MKIILCCLVTETHPEKCTLNGCVVRCIDLNNGGYNPPAQRSTFMGHNPIMSLLKHYQESHGYVDESSFVCVIKVIPVSSLALQAFYHKFLSFLQDIIFNFYLFFEDFPAATMYHDPKLFSQQIYLSTSRLMTLF